MIEQHGHDQITLLVTWPYRQSFPSSDRGSRRNVVRSVPWYRLQSLVRSHRGSRRHISRIGYAVSPGGFSSIASWLMQKRLSEWLRGLNWIVFLDRLVARAETSWLMQKRLANKLRGLTWRVFLDRIPAHTETSFRLVTWSHLEGFPRSHRG